MNTTQNNTSTATKTHTFDVPLPEALYLAEVGLSGASADDVTPTITASVWTLKGDSIETLSTDRYTVHRATVGALGVGEAVLGMPRDALTWLTKNRAYFRRGRSVEEPIVNIRADITAPDGSEGTKPGIRMPAGQVTVTINDALDDRSLSLRTNLVRGNFPPVDRLFEIAQKADEVTASGRINLDFLAKTKALAADRMELAPRLKFTATDNPNKPGPLLVSYERGEALVQPNLLVR